MYHKLVIWLFTALLCGCSYGPREVPGDLSNPKLAELVNASLQEQVRLMNPVWSPGLIPQAAANAQLWLTEINEVVARCRYGPRHRSKFNLIEYDITVASGEVIRDVYTGTRCSYEAGAPLVMRVRFKGGRVVEVLTDGRERKSPVSHAKGEVNLLSKYVIRTDWSRHRLRYFHPAQTAEDLSVDWGVTQR